MKFKRFTILNTIELVSSYRGGIEVPIKIWIIQAIMRNIFLFRLMNTNKYIILINNFQKLQYIYKYRFETNIVQVMTVVNLFYLFLNSF